MHEHAYQSQQSIKFLSITKNLNTCKHMFVKLDVYIF